MSAIGFLGLAVAISFWLVMAGVVLAFVRLARGPTLVDRVVALDMMTVLIVAFCGLFAIFSGDPAFLDVAVVLALVGFLATVALARFAERRIAHQDEERAPPLAHGSPPPAAHAPAEPAEERR